MNRLKTYLTLLYLLGIAPLIWALSSSLTDNSWVSFGLANIVWLSIYAIVFSSLSNKKKSSWLAIIGLVLIVFVALFGLSKVGQSVSDRLYNKALAPTPSEQTLETSTTTGDIDSLEEDADTLEETDESSQETTEDLASDMPSEPWDRFAALDDTTLLNYGQVIPYLVDHYNLTKNGSRAYNFSNMPAGSPLQNAFEVAASHAMIGTSTNPDSNPGCDTYLVLKWLAASWDVGPYTGTPQAAYRAHAETIDQVNGCLEGQFVTKLTL